MIKCKECGKPALDTQRRLCRRCLYGNIDAEHSGFQAPRELWRKTCDGQRLIDAMDMGFDFGDEAST